MKSFNLHKFIPFTILPVTLFSILPYSYLQNSFINNTAVWWVLQTFILYIFWLTKTKFTSKENSKELLLINLYLIWNIINIFRGSFIAESYWDWKGLLSNSFALLLPIIAYVSLNEDLLQRMLSVFIKLGLPFFLVFAFLISRGAYGFYLVPISFILIFFPILTFRWKIIILIFALVVILSDLSARSNVIKFGVPIILGLLYYIRLLIPKILFEVVRNLLIIAPIIFFWLGVSDTFNIFNMDDYSKGEYTELKMNSEGELVEESLTADTRTFLYVEVLQSAQKFNSWWIGRSPARGNESESFGYSDMSGRGERLSNEVAILNIFTWTGVIGVFLFLLVFYRSSYLAVNKSNSIFAKILGIFIAFRWMYAWVEDGNFFNLSTFILWLIIGLCFSKSFRAMTNDEVKYWIWGIFDKRYKRQNNAIIGS